MCRDVLLARFLLIRISEYEVSVGASIYLVSRMEQKCLYPDNVNMESPFENAANRTCALYLEPMLNSYYKSYQDILTLSDFPAGPLGTLVRRINVPKLSQFQSMSAFSPPPTSRNAYSQTCLFALSRYPHPGQSQSIKHGDTFMYAADIPNVYGYLENNGYKIMDNLTTMTFRGPVDIASSSPGAFNGHRRLVCMFRYSQP